MQAKNLGISISMDDVANMIQRSQYFMDESGKFNPQLYFNFLQQKNYTPAQFETLQQNKMLTQKIHDILNEGFLYTPSDLLAYRVFLNRDLQAVFICLDPETYAKGLKIREDDLKDYFDSHRDHYDIREQAKARHILISVPLSAGMPDQAKAKQTLEDLRAQILAGKTTFAAAAAKYSQDTGTQKKGGELGWLDKGATVKEFDEALFRLKTGELSQPVQTKFGFHLIQLEDYQSAHKVAFSEVRSKVEKEYRQEKALSQMLALSGQIASKLQMNEGLDQVGKELSLPVHGTPWFNRRAEISGLKGSLAAAKNLSDLYPGQWKGPLAVGEKEYFFQITEARPTQGLKALDPSDPDFASVRETFQKDLEKLWLKDYLAAQRKELKVKTYLTE
jgi:peptidyl-prolyl cis-trans isomerase D